MALKLNRLPPLTTLATLLINTIFSISSSVLSALERLKSDKGHPHIVKYLKNSDRLLGPLQKAP